MNIWEKMRREREYEVMKRYLKGEYVMEEDKYILDKFASLGYVNFGLDEKEGKTIETAILTPLGKEMYYGERRRRSLVRSILYYLFPI